MPIWHVLIVEDQMDNAEVMETVLSYHGIHPITARSGELALDILQTQNPDLILVDLALPGMSGWELLDKLRARPDTAELPIVAIPAYHSTSVAEKAISAGFDAYFVKPISTASFVSELRRIAG